MSGRAWDTTVNAEFVGRIGQHLAAIRAAGNGSINLNIALDDLFSDYESTIGEIPDYDDSWVDDDDD